VAIKDLKIGDIVLVKAGEKIPVDSKVVGGEGLVNEAPITGESVPKQKSTGSAVYAGTIADSGALDVEMTKAGNDTVFARFFAKPLLPAGFLSNVSLKMLSILSFCVIVCCVCRLSVGVFLFF
jgi:P-type E1-E2 ATPase